MPLHPKPSFDQVGGTHYCRYEIQPWDVALEWGLCPWSHGVIKYLQRYRLKNGLEDLHKAKHYIEYMIANYDKIVEAYPVPEDK